MAKKKAEKTIPQVGEEVEVSSLNTLQFFTYAGDIYSKRKVTPAGVRALRLDGGELKTLPPDTLVSVVDRPSRPKLEEEPGEADVSTEPGEAEAAAGPEEGEAGPEEGEGPEEAEARPEE